MQRADRSTVQAGYPLSEFSFELGCLARQA